MKLEKQDEYAVKILGAIQDMFDEDNENFIDVKELEEDENATHFLQALANIVPTHFYNKFTGNENTTLDVNHIANRLCFQYGKKE